MYCIYSPVTEQKYNIMGKENFDRLTAQQHLNYLNAWHPELKLELREISEQETYLVLCPACFTRFQVVFED